ncbi:MAG: ribonuclease HII [Gemmatimonadales bacterium]|nr:ribonuclease HII [Gemmatimonadales bacterium]
MSFPTLERERALWANGFERVAGIDEVGRGPIAGPVVAAAVVFRPGQCDLEGLRDSKVMTPRARERLAGDIRRAALVFAIGGASVREIDRINIRRATALAMRRALAGLAVSPDYVLLDGLPLPDLGCAHEAVVGGDALCQSVSAAAVLAKCARDRLMARLAVRYPDFGWEHNMGYATREHLASLAQAGPTPHHRRSFAPLAQADLF